MIADFAAMRQAALNYRAKQERERENMRAIIAKYSRPEPDPKLVEEQKRKERAELVQKLVSHKAINGRWPSWFTGHEDRRNIVRECREYAAKHGIIFPWQTPKVKEYAANYYAKNRAKEQAKRRAYYAKNKERMKQQTTEARNRRNKA